MNKDESFDRTGSHMAGEYVSYNKPVAWMEYIQGEEWEVWFVEPTDLPKGHTYKPLYTHPVKELTDEEIEEVFLLNCNLINETFAYRDFARAILRKAQEK